MVNVHRRRRHDVCAEGKLAPPPPPPRVVWRGGRRHPSQRQRAVGRRLGLHARPADALQRKWGAPTLAPPILRGIKPGHRPSLAARAGSRAHKRDVIAAAREAAWRPPPPALADGPRRAGVRPHSCKPRAQEAPAARQTPSPPALPTDACGGPPDWLAPHPAPPSASRSRRARCVLSALPPHPPRRRVRPRLVRSPRRGMGADGVAWAGGTPPGRLDVWTVGTRQRRRYPAAGSGGSGGAGSHVELSGRSHGKAGGGRWRTTRRAVLRASDGTCAVTNTHPAHSHGGPTGLSSVCH